MWYRAHITCLLTDLHYLEVEGDGGGARFCADRTDYFVWSVFASKQTISTVLSQHEVTLGETSGLNILFVCTKVHYEQLCWQQGQVLCTWPMNTVCHRATSNNCLCSSVFFCIVLSASRMKVQRSHSSLQKVFLAQNSVIHHKHIPQRRPTAAANL